MGIPFETKVAQTAEAPWKGEEPRAYVLAQARAKADAVFQEVSEGATVLGADTIVVVEEEVLGKPKDADEARGMLRLLSGRSHRVLTAFRLRNASRPPLDRLVETEVQFRALSSGEIEGYLSTGEWQGKAGAYAIQGIAGAFVSGIRGSYPNVVGLPITEVVLGLLEVGALSSFPLPAEEHDGSF